MITIFDIYPDKKIQTIINLLRHRYDDMESAYLKETGNNIGECIYCKERTKFISISKGYKRICEKNECRKENLRDKRRLNSNNIKISFCKVCQTNSITLINHRHKDKMYICDNDFCQKNKKRPFLNEMIIDNFEYDNFSYLNKLIYDLKQLYDIRKVKKIIYRNLLYNNIDDVSAYIRTPELRDVLNIDNRLLTLTLDEKYWINKNQRALSHLYKSIYKSKYLEHIKKYYPDNISKCLICDNEYVSNNPFNKHNTSNVTCSLDCYYKNFKFYITDERKIKQSNSIKKSIESGKFTPNVFNSRTHKNITLFKCNKEIIQKFRSSWELIYYVMNYSDNLEYETLRLPYSFKNKHHIYIVDFVNHISKTVIEIKGNSELNKEINIIKDETLQKWSNVNGYRYSIENDNFLLEYKFKVFIKKLSELDMYIEDYILNRIKKYLK